MVDSTVRWFGSYGTASKNSQVHFFVFLGEPGEHSHLKSDGLDVNDRLENVRVTSRDFEVVSVTNHYFKVHHKDSDLSFKIVRPVATFSNIHSKSVSKFKCRISEMALNSKYQQKSSKFRLAHRASKFFYLLYVLF